MTAQAGSASLLGRAKALMGDGQADAALALLIAEKQNVPDHYECWLLASKLHYQWGDYKSAVAEMHRAERLDPLMAEFSAIQRHIQNRNLYEAAQTARLMLGKITAHPRAIFTLAHLALAEGDYEAAVDILKTGLEVSPANGVLRHMLLGAQEGCGNYRASIETAKRLFDIDGTAEAAWEYITVLLRYGQNLEALRVCDQMQSLIAGDRLKRSEIAFVRGQVLRILGQTEDSVAAFRDCLSDNPNKIEALWALSDFKTYPLADADIARLNAALKEPRQPAEQKSLAAFALARVSENKGNAAEAMTLYEMANRLQTSKRFDPDGFRAGAARLIHGYSSQILEVQASAPHLPAIPIFIVGLPRSGSTLVEQILASHSQIEGTIEQPLVPSVKRKAHLMCQHRYGRAYLDGIGQFTDLDLSQLRQIYLDEVMLFKHSDAPFYTDKLPFNFEHIGFIHKFLPEAFIIDVRRHPLDCGYSLYKQHFPEGSDFSYDLSHIGAYYTVYLEIMDHWDRVLPGKVIRIEYESLVRSPDTVIPNLLSRLGLDFETASMRPHLTRRAVRTTSSEQVRQPINTNGIGAWRSVEPQLQGLIHSLGPTVLKRFDHLL